MEHFFFFMLNLVCTTLSASAIGFFLSATVRIFAIANLLIALCYVFMMVSHSSTSCTFIWGGVLEPRDNSQQMKCAALFSSEVMGCNGFDVAAKHVIVLYLEVFQWKTSLLSTEIASCCTCAACTLTDSIAGEVSSMQPFLTL